VDVVNVLSCRGRLGFNKDREEFCFTLSNVAKLFFGKVLIVKISRRSLLAGLASTAFLISSCGDSANEVPIVSNGNVAPVPTNQRYLGSIVANGQTARLDMTVAGNGDVTGLLTSSAQAQGLLSPQVSLSGFSEPDGGNFYLANDDRTIVLGGYLPIGDARTTLGLGTPGGSFAGALQKASLGAPQASESEGLVHAISFFGSELTAFQFVASRDFNGPNPPFPSLNPQVIEFTGWVMGNSQGSTGNRIFAYAIPFSDVTPRNPLLAFWAQLPDDQSFLAGDTFPVNPNLINGSACGLRSGDSYWSTLAAGAAGSLTITAASNQGMEFDFEFTGVGPGPVKSPNPAQGSFRCNGHYKAVYGPF
jgi:hypothetical protein